MASTSFADIFKEETTLPRSTSSSFNVTPDIRSLACDDLHRALCKSNRELILDGDLIPEMLKTDDELLLLTTNTEEAIFREHATSPRKYIETIYTYLAFLLDRNLSNDAVLFRFMLNMEMNNMYSNTNTVQLIFSELFYAPYNVADKYKHLLRVLNAIEENVDSVLQYYTIGKNYTRRVALSYTTPAKLQKAMSKFQEEQIDNLLAKLMEYKRITPDDFVGSIDSGSQDSNLSLEHLFGGSDDNSDNMTLEGILSDASEEDEYSERSVPVEPEEDEYSDRSVPAEPEEDEYSERSIPVEREEDEYSEASNHSERTPKAPSVVSDLTSLLDQMQSPSSPSPRSPSPRSPSSSSPSSPSPRLPTPRSPSPSLSPSPRSPSPRSPSPSPSLSLSSVPHLHSSGKCESCNAPVNLTSYRTPVMTNDAVYTKSFCGWECMEKWNP